MTVHVRMLPVRLLFDSVYTSSFDQIFDKTTHTYSALQCLFYCSAYCYAVWKELTDENAMRRFRLAVDMKFFIHIHIDIHKFSLDIHGYIYGYMTSIYTASLTIIDVCLFYSNALIEH